MGLWWKESLKEQFLTQLTHLGNGLFTGVVLCVCFVTGCFIPAYYSLTLPAPYVPFSMPFSGGTKTKINTP